MSNATEQRVLIKVIHDDRVFFFTPEMYDVVNDSMPHFQLVARAQYVYGISETECILKNRTISVDAMITDIALSNVVQKPMPKKFDYAEFRERVGKIIDTVMNPPQGYSSQLVYGEEEFDDGKASIICTGTTIYITIPQTESIDIDEMTKKYSGRRVYFSGSSIGCGVTIKGSAHISTADLVVLDKVGKYFDLDGLTLKQHAIIVSVAKTE